MNDSRRFQFRVSFSIQGATSASAGGMFHLLRCRTAVWSISELNSWTSSGHDFRQRIQLFLCPCIPWINEWTSASLSLPAPDDPFSGLWSTRHRRRILIKLYFLAAVESRCRNAGSAFNGNRTNCKAQLGCCSTWAVEQQDIFIFWWSPSHVFQVNARRWEGVISRSE